LECSIINDDNDIALTVQKRKPLDIAWQYNEVKDLIKNLQDIIAKYKSNNKKVAVWGAGHRTLALLALCNLNGIEYVVDSASFKQGRFTPVLHLKIEAPDCLKERPVDLVIIMVPGLYPGEVMKTIKQMELKAEIAVLCENRIEFR
jgi:hypothetical protein